MNLLWIFFRCKITPAKINRIIIAIRRGTVVAADVVAIVAVAIVVVGLGGDTILSVNGGSKRMLPTHLGGPSSCLSILSCAHRRLSAY